MRTNFVIDRPLFYLNNLLSCCIVCVTYQNYQNLKLNLMNLNFLINNPPNIIIQYKKFDARSMNIFTDCIQSVRNFLDQDKITQALITNKGRNFVDQRYYIEKRDSYQREPIVLCAIQRCLQILLRLLVNWFISEKCIACSFHCYI